MTNKKRSKQLEDFIRHIKDEWKGTFRKSPDLTIFALKDEQVCAAIEKRFREEAGITAVRQLDYDFYTGLHHLVFEFAPRLGAIGVGGADALMVILDSDCKVVAVVDPFDPVQPNKFVPPLPNESELPFVLDRPSFSEDVTFSSEALYPLQVRSRAFFERLRVSGRGPPIPDPRGITICSYQTTTPWFTIRDTVVDDCRQPPILT